MDNPIWGIPPDFRIDSDYIDRIQLAQTVGWAQKERKLSRELLKSTGEGVLVIVLDTINDHNHPDLPRPFWSKDYANSSNRNMHGWHVGGTIAAKNNDMGVLGWAPDVTIGWGSVLSDSGSGSTAGIHQAVRDVTRNWLDGWNKDFSGCIINMSLGGPRDPRGEEVYKRANDAGICVIAAAGNSGPNSGIGSPGNYVHTVTTASYGRDGRISDFSSGGPEVDIAMGGEGILSTVPGDRYGRASGTSMATPAAVGVAALIISSRPYDMDIKNSVGMRKYLAKFTEDRGRRGEDDRFGSGVPILSKLIRSPRDWYF